MTTIVAPVNFTANSSNAARYAADMALAIKADLHLVHVLHWPISAAEFPLTDYVFEEMHKAAAASLQELWDELALRTNEKVNIAIHLEVGGVEERLEEFCQEHKPFFVIMGTAGNNLERVFAASNTSVAIRRLPYPLIVVPENAVFHTIKMITLACDLEDIFSNATVPTEFLKELQSIFAARFDVINIDTRKEQTVVEGVHRRIAGSKADLLMVFPKKHSFLEFHKSQAKRIALNSTVPVISLPTYAKPQH